MRKLFALSLIAVVVAFSSCATPPVQSPPPVEAAEITSYVTNATDVSGEADISWIELKWVYETKFDNGVSLYAGYSWALVHWLTWSDGGFYQIGTLEPGEDANNLPITFFHPGEIAVIEKDGKPFLYFKFEDGKVYMAKEE